MDNSPLNNTQFNLPQSGAPGSANIPPMYGLDKEEKIKNKISKRFTDNPFKMPIVLILVIAINIISILLLGYVFRADNWSTGDPLLVKKESTIDNTDDLPQKTVTYGEEDKDYLTKIVNQYRQSEGLSTLTRDAELDASAQAHAEDMFSRYYFSHVDPEGKSPYDRLNNTDYAKVGENIIQGNMINVLNPDNALKEWIKSAPHQETLRSPDWRLTGVGVKQGTRLNPKTNKEEPVIIWVQLFAVKR